MTRREKGERLFENDCETSIFCATIGNFHIGEPFAVNVYPRKTGTGFVWLVWDCRKPLTDIGMHTIHSGGRSRSTDKAEAIQEGVAELMKTLARLGG